MFVSKIYHAFVKKNNYSNFIRYFKLEDCHVFDDPVLRQTTPIRKQNLSSVIKITR